MTEVGERICHWLEANIPAFGQPDPFSRVHAPTNNVKSIARLFYEDFRNGLVHEGRIKNRGQFSLDLDQLLDFDHLAMVVNPRMLLEEVARVFGSYCGVLRQSRADAEMLTRRLEQDFHAEMRP